MTEDQTPPMSQPRVAAGALSFDEEGRVLLVKPTYKEGWDIPGGYVEPGETPLQACHREVREELGIELEIGRLLVVDWAPAASEGDKVLFIFDGGTLHVSRLEQLHLQAEELSDAAYHASSALQDLLVDRLARRVAAAMRAYQTRTTFYLEHGRLPGID